MEPEQKLTFHVITCTGTGMESDSRVVSVCLQLTLQAAVVFKS